MLIKLLVIVVGIGMGLNGHQEFKLRSLASDEPVPVELADLEAGRPLPDVHIRLGHHWKLMGELIYSYRLKKGEEEGPSTRINYAFYPLVSEGHPHSQAFDVVPAGYESWAEVPQDDWPVLERFAVLVRSKQFETVGALPDGSWQEADSLTGMVVNEIRKLDDDERALLQQSYRGLDLDRVLILEEGRRPESMTWCLALMGGGGGLVLLGLFWIVRSATGRREEAGELPPEAPPVEMAR